MKTYTRDFKKVVWGYATVMAESIEEAEKIFDDGMFDEFDNKSEYEFISEIEESD